MMKQASVKKNAILNIIYTLVNILFPIITFPYASRILLVERMGTISFFSSIANYAIMVGSLGISMYGIRATAKIRNDKKMLSKVVIELETINVIATIIVLIVLGLSIPFVHRLSAEPALLVVNGVLILSGAFSMNWLYSGLEQYGYITRRTIAVKFIAIILMLLLVHTINDYVIYAAIIALSTIASNMLNFLYSRKFIRWSRNEPLEYRHHFKPMLLLFSSILAVSVYTNLDTVMLGFISGDREVGLYTVAVKSKTLLLTTVNAISTVLLPRLSYYFSNRMEKEYNRTVSKSVSVIFMISIPLTLFFILEATDCIAILGGKDYLDATLCMQIIMPVLLISGFSNITGNQVLIPLGKDAYFMKAVTAGAVVDLVLNMFLIPAFGSVGAAAATLLAEIIQMSTQLYYSKQYILPNIKWMTIIKVILSAVLAGLLTYFVSWNIAYNALIRIVLLGMTYFCTYAIGLMLLREKMFIGICTELTSKVLHR